MNTVCATHLDSAIGALCPDIWGNMQTVSNIKYSEEELWEELVCCVLSSQVKFELSQAVTQNLKADGLLDLSGSNGVLQERLEESLRTPIMVNGRSVRYRFPNAKARQINSAWENLYGSGISLREIMNEHLDSSELRATLVQRVPGLGMKQASMYLRNVYNSFELAIIDSHVLKYMDVMNMVKKVPSAISQAQYLAKESMLSKYAEKFGYPVGCVDYAIWIVMRVASKDGYL